ncbi:MAG: hypothetical protein CSB55_04615 [Candidatus Cloacimonadota bacterium]|nr:MAG: hypothetical protein CSB55_04615 [Candidatus Cloacimonadota bacterium]
MKKYYEDVIKGFFIGAANIIPGVSGGTFALILGIYERLISAISSIDLNLLKLIKEFFIGKNKSVSFKKIAEITDLWFLCRIGGGAFISIVFLSRIIEYFLHYRHETVYAFFLGLIIPSLLIPYRMIGKIRTKEVVAFATAVIFLLVISIQFGHLADEKEIMKAEAKELRSEEYFNPFLTASSGALAISAMILPGISGSFILLLTNQYDDVLAAINSHDFIYLGFLTGGMLIGLVAFTKLLKFLMTRFHSETLSFLLGLMTASIYPLWPFKKIMFAGGKTFYGSENILPEFDKTLAIAAIAFISGFVLVIVLEKFASKNSGEKDELV